MVRWAEDGTRKAALERLAAAREELRKDPEHERALRDALAALLELERWGEAADTLAPLAASHPEEPQLHAEQAALLIRARRWIDAVDVLRTLVAVHPDDAGAWFNLAVAHQALGHLADARRAWDRTIALSPTAPAYAQRGAVLLDQHDWEAAASDFATVLRDEPDAQDATLNLALALEKLGRRDEARDRLAAWLEHHPRDVPALNRLAELAWAAYQAVPKADRRRWCGEAADACRRSLEIDPRQPAIRDLLETAERAARAADQ
jgi:Flp pilus assembly protein TadD